MIIRNLSFFLFFFAVALPLMAAEEPKKTPPTQYPHDVIENGFINVVLEEAEIAVAHNNLKSYRDAEKNVIAYIFDTTYRLGIVPNPEGEQRYNNAVILYNKATLLLEYLSHYPIPQNLNSRTFCIPAPSWPLLCDSLPDSLATDAKKTFYKTIADNLAPEPRPFSLDCVHFDHFLKNTSEKPVFFTMDPVKVIRSFLYPFESRETFHNLENHGDCVYATSRCGGLVPHVEKDANTQQVFLVPVEPHGNERTFFKTQLCENGTIEIKTDGITIETGLWGYNPSFDHIDYSQKYIAACITKVEKLYIGCFPTLSKRYVINSDTNNPTIPIVTVQEQEHRIKNGMSFRKSRLDTFLIKHATLLTMHPNKNCCIIQVENSSLGRLLSRSGSNTLFKAKWTTDKNTWYTANISPYANNTNFKKLLFITDNTLLGLSNDGNLFIGWVPKNSELCTFIPQKHPSLVFENIATEYGSTLSSSCVALLTTCGKLFCALPFGERGKKGNIILYRQAKKYKFYGVKNMYLENLHIIMASYYSRTAEERWCSNIVPSFE